MQELDLDRFGHQKAIERVCLGVAAVIVNDEREELGDHPPVPGDAGIRRDENLPKTSTAEKSDEFWESHHPQYWTMLSRTWDRQDEDLKAAISDEKREVVDLLRKWQPWERDDAVEEKDELLLERMGLDAERDGNEDAQAGEDDA